MTIRLYLILATSLFFSLAQGQVTVSVPGSAVNATLGYDVVYPNSNRVAYYTFTEGSGSTSADVSGNGHTATLNGVTFDGDTAVFDGVDNHYISTANLLDTFPDIGTISFDYTPTGIDNEDKRFFSKRIGATLIQFYKQVTTGKLITNGSITPPDYTWVTGRRYYITLTWEVEYMFIYINGVLYDAIQKSSDFDATGTARPFIIGAFDNVTEYLRVPNAKIGRFEVREDFMSTQKSISNYNQTFFVASSLLDKFLPQQGDTFIIGDGVNENNSVLEYSNEYFLGQYFHYYTANYENGTQNLHAATSSTPDGAVTKFASNPVIANVTHTGTIVVGDSLYVFAGGSNVNCYSTGDGFNFINRGVVLTNADFPNITGFGNICLTDSAGTYIMIVECAVSTGESWLLHRAVSSSIASSWTITHKLSELQVPTSNGIIQTGAGTTGGAWVKWDAANNKYHLVYHFGYTGVQPTYLAYATATTSTSWTILEAPIKWILEYPFDATDQIADPWIKIDEANNKIYLYFEYCNNVGIQESKIMVCTFSGTLTQLTTP